MPKKIEIVEMILHSLNGGDAVSDQQARYHPAMVSEVTGEIYSHLINSLVTQNTLGRNDNFSLDGYTKTFPKVLVLFDEERCEHYSVLPSEILHLPYQRGIRFISPTHDQSSQFIQRSNNSSVVFLFRSVERAREQPATA